MNTETNHNNFDEFFKEELQGFSANPSDGLWSNLSSQLSRLNFFKFSYNNFNIWYASIIILASAVGTISSSDYYNDSEENIKINTETSPSNAEGNNSQNTSNASGVSIDEDSKTITNTNSTPNSNSDLISTPNKVAETDNNINKKEENNIAEGTKDKNTNSDKNNTRTKEASKQNVHVTNHKKKSKIKEDTNKKIKIVYSKTVVGSDRVQRDTVIINQDKH